jgi:hypothetical protein
MASTVTFGQIEGRIRRDILNDNEPDQYRWSVFQVMAAMNVSVVDIAARYNAWAGYEIDTGKRIYNLHTRRIEETCQLEPTAQGEIETADEESLITELRALVIPIDDRYADAVAYIAASRLVTLDDSDTENSQRAASFLQLGMEYAIR